MMIEKGIHYQFFKGQSMITSYREKGLHYQLTKGQSMITSYIEEGIHYQVFKGQSRVGNEALLLYVMLSWTAP
jgi:hypothetical protein